MSSSPPAQNTAETRAELRRISIARREALSAPARVALTVHLCAHLEILLGKLAPTCLAFCWPHRGEPDLRALMRAWLAGGKARGAALPVVLDRQKALAFRAWTPQTDLVVDRYGIPHPPDGAFVEPDCVLVPLNAFDARGYRLGYGGGYFDRTLARSTAIAIGVGFELGRFDTVLPQTHDRPMDWIVTEQGVFRSGDR
ncbi:MAG: 5-formyltetrahydrofolate cyclo-ligase [Rhodocyclales bacterium]|nr:5-formyltetrahydrofolate cyclo-ligase [Rhodocyclales bacterium]